VDSSENLIKEVTVYMAKFVDGMVDQVSLVFKIVGIFVSLDLKGKNISYLFMSFGSPDHVPSSVTVIISSQI
jgi:hypothetical protein